MVFSPAAGAADGAFAVQTALSEVRGRLLQLLGPATDANDYVYLNLAPDLPLRAAELQFLDDAGTPVARVRFRRGDGRRGLYRDTVPDGVRESRRCRFVIAIAGDGAGERHRLPCRLPDRSSPGPLELRFREHWLGPELKIHAWRPDADGGPRGFRDLSVKDLLGRVLPAASSASLAAVEGQRAVAPDVRYSAAICLDDPWAGLHRLFDYKDRGTTPMPAAFWRAYADCALRAGVHGEAVAALRELERRGATLAIHETRLQLGAHHDRWGDTAGVLDWLARDPAAVPAVLRSRWRDLVSRQYLALGRFEDAVTVLSRGQHLDAAGSWTEAFDAAPLHYAMRINYAYALMHVGRRDEALAVLDRVGDSPALDAATGALRARANTVLGWQFLSQGYGATAGRVFHRVSLDSPAARKALLGMGWAMLAPRGEARPLVEPPGFAASPLDPPATALKSLRRIDAIGCAQYNAVVADAVQDCVPSERFDRVAYAGDAPGQMRRALRFWDALIERDDIRDAAILEAHVAAAGAYGELGAGQHERDLYRRAVALSEEALAALDRQAARVSERERWLALAAGESGVLGDGATAILDWLARSRTQALLESVAAAQRLSAQISAALDTPLRRTGRGVELASLRARVSAARDRALRLLRDEASAVIAGERERFERYRVRASLGLAEIQRRAALSGVGR
ncbi:hypothetical protein PC39_14052 [Salinisphaera sp. PC39]